MNRETWQCIGRFGRKRFKSLKWVWLLFGLCTLSSCYEPAVLPLEEACHPKEPQCALLDYDEDGTPNGVDDFPLDPLCAQQSNEHCGACNRACGQNFNCQEGVCIPIRDELCDGLDNDLDQRIDEMLTPPVASLHVGVCEGSTKICGGGQGWLNPSLDAVNYYEEIELACDGLDNDCDGRVDELLMAPLATPQLGVCFGITLTCEGEQGWVVPDRRQSIEDYEVSETRCDDLDNDCDGRVDERVDGGVCQTGQQGRCAAGQEQCIDGVMNCVPIAEAIDEVCNFIDDDCDGEVDEAEDLLTPEELEAFGVCRQPPARCERGEWSILPIEGLPEFELIEQSCDGLDNDCDGFTDEGVPINPCEISTAIGPCREGRTQCNNATLSCVPLIEEEAENCDGFDNDCDGAIDEDVRLPLYIEQRGVCAGLTSLCEGEQGVVEADPSQRLEYEQEEYSCDGLDNDCDGQVDENLVSEACNTNLLGICQDGLSRCTEGQTICIAPLQQPEVCDGLDNDCDGAVDEGLTAPTTNLFQGVCADRQQVCRGEQGWQDPLPSPLFEVTNELSCDGLDNDCDGQIDEALPERIDPNPLLKGVCKQQILICEQGLLRAPHPDERVTQQLSFEIQEQSCDGLDNDCDGLIDESPSLGWGDCESSLQGQCQAGVYECQSNQLLCQPLETPQAELCDGADNDCDGLVDEQIITGPCSVGQGICLNNGQVRCIQGSFQCDALEGDPQDELCNRTDDDCDGMIDETYALKGITCSVGVGTCARQGEWLCDQGQLSCSVFEGPPQTERCDTLDNDCDGQTDEDFFQLGRTCVSGIGVCEIRGFWQCSDTGDLQCGSQVILPQSERCDGLDNDCDGQSDEHSSIERCDDIDNDCDGLVDETQTEETCNNSDDDCDGVIDESPCAPCLDSNLCPTLTWYSLPSGDYLMGGEDDNNQPIHPVRLQAFQLSDEITVAQYQRCVVAGVCTEAGTGGDCNFGRVDLDNHPINCVSWRQAYDFAYWIGGRLPSESEWEYAARAAGLNAPTPWGGVEASCDFALLRNEDGFACGIYQTVSIRNPRNSAGVSPQGLWDLLGNVSEWVEDDYVPHYQDAPSQGEAYCDLGICDVQGEKVHRGGGWRVWQNEVTNRTRQGAFYQLKSAEIGFRVARYGP